MADESKIFAAGRIGVIPNFTLGWFRLEMLATASAWFKDQATQQAAKAAASLRTAGYGDAASEVMMSHRIAVGTGGYNVFQHQFELASRDLANLPMLLWMSLLVHHPDLKMDQVKALITPENEAELLAAIYERMGFDPERDPQKKVDPMTNRKNRAMAEATPTG